MERMVTMFTGIVEETGTIQAIKKTGLSMALTIAASKVTSDVKLGDSIAVNGICLTVTGFSDNQFTVDVMPETVKSTSLNGLSKGSKVNLEERCPPTDGSAATLYQGMWTERRKLRGLRKKQRGLLRFKTFAGIDKNARIERFNYGRRREPDDFRSIR